MRAVVATIARVTDEMAYVVVYLLTLPFWVTWREANFMLAVLHALNENGELCFVALLDKAGYVSPAVNLDTIGFVACVRMRLYVSALRVAAENGKLNIACEDGRHIGHATFTITYAGQMYLSRYSHA